MGDAPVTVKGSDLVSRAAGGRQARGATSKT